MMAFSGQAKIGAIVLLFGWVLLNFNKHRGYVNHIFKFFVPFLLLGIAASIWSQTPELAFQKSISYSLIFFCIPIVLNAGLKDDEYMSSHIILFLTSLFTIGIFSYIISPEFGTLAGRYRGLMGNPNGMGILLTLTGPLYLLHKKIFPNHQIARIPELIFLSSFVLSLILTGSRTSLFALLLFLFFVRIRYFSNAFSLILFIVIVVGYDYILSSLPLLADMFGLKEYLRIETLQEGSGRLIAWNFAWEKIQDVFFVGGGFGFTELTFKRYLLELSMLGHQGNAHNSYLTLWMDTGLIGLILFLFGMIRTLTKAASHSPLALPMAYCVLFSANFESWMSASLNPFTSLFLICLSLILYQKVKGKESPELPSPIQK
jgi:O-antigen ligase